MAGDDQVIYSDDYTKLFTYQSRQFTAGDISLRAINGIQWNAVPAAVIITAAVTAATVGGMWLVGLSGWWALLVFPVPLVVVYVRMAKDRSGGLTEAEKYRLALHARYRQPKEFLGLARNTEPTDFTFDVILWTPPPVTGRPA